MQDTKISWCDVVWNPTRGCSRVSPGCVHCYAEKIAARFSGGPAFTRGQMTDFMLARQAGLPVSLQPKRYPYAGFAEFRIVGGKREAHWTGKMELIEDKLLEPLKRRKWALQFADKHGRKPRCFVNSMSDLFHENLPDESIGRVFAIMTLCPEIDFMVLTKRAKRMDRWVISGGLRHRHVEDSANKLATELGLRTKDSEGVSLVKFPCESMPWPLPNVRLGTSTEDQPRFNQRIVPLMQLSEMGWKTMISAEPLLGPIDMEWPDEINKAQECCTGFECGCRAMPINPPLLYHLKDTWVITGAESGQGARPCDEAWIRSLQRQCQDNHVPFFYKQAATPGGHKIPTPEINGKRYVEFPAVGLRG